MHLNGSQKLVLAAALIGFVFFLTFPRWEQLYKTDQRYERIFQLRTELGRRPLFLPPRSISENRGGGPIPATDFIVLADWQDAGIWCLAIAAISAVMLLVFRRGRSDPVNSEIVYLTIRRRIISAVLLALLLPIPGVHGKPFVYAIYGIIEAYLTGSLGERFVLPALFLYWALFLLVSSVAIFLVLSLLARILKSRARQPQP
jgi:hypothetical protein